MLNRFSKIHFYIVLVGVYIFTPIYTHAAVLTDTFSEVGSFYTTSVISLVKDTNQKLESIGNVYQPLFLRTANIYNTLGNTVLNSFSEGMSKTADAYADSFVAVADIGNVFNNQISRATDSLGNVGLDTVVGTTVGTTKIATGVSQNISNIGNGVLSAYDTNITNTGNQIAGLGSIWDSFIDITSDILVPLFLDQTPPSLPLTKPTPPRIFQTTTVVPTQTIREVVRTTVNNIIQTSGITRAELVSELANLRQEILSLSTFHLENSRVFNVGQTEHIFTNVATSITDSLSAISGSTITDSSFSGSVSATTLDVSDATATSTFAGNLSVAGNFNFEGVFLQNGAPFAGSQWTTSGSDIYYSTGAVGVGTSSPFASFAVNPIAGQASNQFVVGSSTATNFIITNAGNVGIGTTTPTTKLQVDGTFSVVPLPSTDSTIKFSIGNLGQITQSNGTSGYSGSSMVRNNFGNSEGSFASGATYFNINPGTVDNTSYVFRVQEAGSTYLSVLGNGNIGVGSSTPFASFAINPIAGQASNQFVVGSSTATNFIITNVGNVGIGTTIPTQKLDVAGSVNVSSGSAYMYNGVNVITAQTASDNYFFGGAGNLTGDGSENTATGFQALLANTSGNDNTANGYQALYSNTEGHRNIAVGAVSLNLNTTGSDNIAIGYSSLQNNIIGVSNTAIGTSALLMSTVSNNTAIGFQSLMTNTTGSSNTAVGVDSLILNTTGTYNSAYGREALYSNTSGDSNTALGYTSLSGNTTGSWNTAIGHSALLDLNITANDGSGNNTALGYKSGQGLITGINNTFIGANITVTNSALSNNIILADGAGNQRINVDSLGAVGISSSTPWATFAINPIAGQASNQFIVGSSTATNFIITNAGNVGIGTTSPVAKLSVAGNIDVDATYAYKYNGSNVITASTTLSNYFFGGAGNLTITGTSNTATGYQALLANTTGINNSAQGVTSLFSNIDGAYNSAQGYQSLFSNTAGDNNSAQGVASLYANTTGDNNSALGYQAGRFITGGSIANATGSYSLFLGDDTKALADGQTNQIVIGSGAIGIGSNTVTLGNDSIVTTALKGNVGIGTTTPFATLAVNPIAGQASNQFVVGSSTATNFKIDNSGHIFAPNLKTAGTSESAVCITDGPIRQITVNQGVTTCLVSSARFKHEINDSTAGLDLVRNLRPVSFIYNGQTNEHLGFIAEEVFALEPRLAAIGDDGLPRSVRYEELTSVLAKAIQEMDINLNTIISTSTASTTPTSLTFATSFWTSVTAHIGAWLSDATNGISKMFAGEVNTDKLCIGTTCVTEEQLKAMLQNSGATAPTPTVITTETTTPIPTPITSTTTATVSDPTPTSSSTTTPETPVTEPTSTTTPTSTEPTPIVIEPTPAPTPAPTEAPIL